MGEVFNNNLVEKFIIVFKRIYPTNCLRKNFLNIMLNKDTYNSISSSIISIPENNHILYKDDTLYFLSYKIASEVLSLYSEYRSATNDEVECFIKKISYDSNKYDFQKYAIKKIRKRIALILDSKILDNYNEQDLFLEAKKQGLNLLFDENKKIIFDLKDKKGTLLILDFLSENTFLSTFSKERNRTNSKEKI